MRTVWFRWWNNYVNLFACGPCICIDIEKWHTLNHINIAHIIIRVIKKMDFYLLLYAFPWTIVHCSIVSSVVFNKNMTYFMTVKSTESDGFALQMFFLLLIENVW